MTVFIDSRNINRVPGNARDSDEPMKTFYGMRNNAFNMSDGCKKREKKILSFFAAQPAVKKAKGNQASEADASHPDTSENTAVSTDQPTEFQSGA